MPRDRHLLHSIGAPFTHSFIDDIQDVIFANSGLGFPLRDGEQLMIKLSREFLNPRYLPRIIFVKDDRFGPYVLICQDTITVPKQRMVRAAATRENFRYEFSRFVQSGFLTNYPHGPYRMPLLPVRPHGHGMDILFCGSRRRWINPRVPMVFPDELRWLETQHHDSEPSTSLTTTNTDREMFEIQQQTGHHSGPHNPGTRSAINFSSASKVPTGSYSRSKSNFTNAAWGLKASELENTANSASSKRIALYVKLRNKNRREPGLFTLDGLKKTRQIHPHTRAHFGKSDIRKVKKK